MKATVGDIAKILENIAPSHLSEKWDNVGLQVGQMDWPVRTIMTALDPSPDVVAAACRDNIDLLITHHPLIFRALKSIDFTTPVGSIIRMAILNKMALFAVHTNFDSVAEGLNDVLAEKVGLTDLEVLRKTEETGNYKLVMYVPVEYEEEVLNTIFKTKTGNIGDYEFCSFRNNGKGTYMPVSYPIPSMVDTDKISDVDEIRIETIVKKKDIKEVVEYISKRHPYETMTYDITPVITYEGREGLGRVGLLRECIRLDTLAVKIKEKLGLNAIKIAGKPDLPVKKAAVCTGSGSSLMKDFFSSGAQVYISGDLRYHDARDVEAAGLGLIDIGHFGSEYQAVELLQTMLKKIISESGFDIKVEAFGFEKDPFVIL